jgi:hypothetical protein
MRRHEMMAVILNNGRRRHSRPGEGPCKAEGVILVIVIGTFLICLQGAQ